MLQCPQEKVSKEEIRLEGNGLKKTIRLPQAVALYVGAVLGSGVLLVPGMAADIAGPASLLAWGIMALLVIPMALTMGLLSAKYPNAGGVSHFVTMAFGKRFGALAGWFFLLSVPLGVPINGVTAAEYVGVPFHWGMTAKIIFAFALVAVGVLTNVMGMQVAGQIQVAVVITIVIVLVGTFFGAVPQFDASYLTPFMPHGWWSVGEAMTMLFWCYIGWEAISHLSEEFVDPEKAAKKGVFIAAIVVGILYMMAAVATVATGSYGGGNSAAALSRVLQGVFGQTGGYVAGAIALFTNTATVIAYTGAASRVGLSLARNGHAPRLFGIMHKTRQTPIGALTFLSVCFTIVLCLYAGGVVSLAKLIQLPNATFIATYLAGCFAGVKLMRESYWGYRFSWISLILTLVVVPFLGWMVLYPVAIALVVLWRVKPQNEIRTSSM